MADVVALVEEDVSGETGDFEGFFADSYERIVRALFLVCGSRAEAEDVAQDAFARVFERWERVRRMDSPVGYVMRVGMRLQGRRRKRAARGRELERIDMDATMDLAASAAMTSDVMRALASLTREQRQVLVLSEWLGLSGDEAASILGIRAGAFRVRLHRAREAFKEMIGDDYA